MNKLKGNNEYSLTEKSVLNGMNNYIEILHNKCGKTFKTTPYNFLRKKNKDGSIGCNCSNCIKERVIKERTKTTEEYKKEVKELVGDEYLVKGDYIKNSIKIPMLHTVCGKTWEVKPNDFLYGHRCPTCCLKSISNKEKELFNFIKENYNGTIIENTRNILINKKDKRKNKEIDIYIPDLKLAFEFNGLYFHSSYDKKYNNLSYNDKKLKNKHLLKTNKCEKLGIQLIHIWDDDWNDELKNKILKSKIRYLLHSSNDLEKVRASKCRISYPNKNNCSSKEELKSITKEISLARNFLNENHIQGAARDEVYLILYGNNKNNKEEIMSVMTFKKPNKDKGYIKNNCEYDYELDRYATNSNYIIYGAFNKLFKYFEMNFEWNKIVTYADREWSKGDIYFNNGWNYVGNTSIKYWYTDSYKRFSRQKFQKKKLETLYPEFYDENLSEKEIMQDIGIGIIYGTDNLKFEYIRK